MASRGKTVTAFVSMGSKKKQLRANPSPRASTMPNRPSRLSTNQNTQAEAAATREQQHYAASAVPPSIYTGGVSTKLAEGESEASPVRPVRRRHSSRIPFRDEFQYLVRLSRKYQLTLPEVREHRADFKALDTDNDDWLTLDHFLEVVRKQLRLSDKDAIPDFLLARLSLHRDGMVNFEEYLMWCKSTAYEESILVRDPKERQLRQLARDNGYHLTDVEKVKRVFDEFDCDGSGEIDEQEFGNAIRVLLEVKNPGDMSDSKLKRFWREVDLDHSGLISFEEFLAWYFKSLGITSLKDDE